LNVAKIRFFVPGFDPKGISPNTRAIGRLSASGSNAPIDLNPVSTVWRSSIRMDICGTACANAQAVDDPFNWP
jgi:hypothetical protein